MQPLRRPADEFREFPTRGQHPVVTCISRLIHSTASSRNDFSMSYPAKSMSSRPDLPELASNETISRDARKRRSLSRATGAKKKMLQRLRRQWLIIHGRAVGNPLAPL